jgi:hypothetical protein
MKAELRSRRRKEPNHLNFLRTFLLLQKIFVFVKILYFRKSHCKNFCVLEVIRQKQNFSNDF